MRIEEAIEHLRDINTIAKTRHMMRDVDGELEDGEIQLYRERFEAVKMGIAALEKQIPQKPTNLMGYACRECNGRLARQTDLVKQKYCHHCGQALKWGGATDGDTSTD
jgi:hypothetical protein